MPCVLVVLCACYGGMCDWLNVEIYVVDMCYWEWALCSCWWGDVLLELRKGWKQIVKNDCDEIELRWWSNDVMMNCENMNIGERPIILFIFAYQIWRIWKWKQPQKGGDFRMWKRYEAGTPASEKKENGRGLPQLKKIWGGDSRKKKKRMGEDSQKRKRKEWRGLPQEKKKGRNVYGRDSRSWMMIWWGLPQEKG